MFNNRSAFKMINAFFICAGAACALAGCTYDGGIENKVTRDRVNACSTGFSNDLSAALQVAYDKTAIKGGVVGDLKNESKAAIIDSLSESDRLKGYEDYIACIEGNWNNHPIASVN